MKLVILESAANGEPVMINVDLIRMISPQDLAHQPRTQIVFSETHAIYVNGTIAQIAEKLAAHRTPHPHDQASWNQQ